EVRAVDRERLELVLAALLAPPHPEGRIRELARPRQRTRVAELHQDRLADMEGVGRADVDVVDRLALEQRRKQVPDDREAHERGDEAGEADGDAREELAAIHHGWRSSLIRMRTHPTSDAAASTPPATATTTLVMSPTASSVTPVASAAGQIVGAGWRCVIREAFPGRRR